MKLTIVLLVICCVFVADAAWTYSQKAGELKSADGKVVGKGCSGLGSHKNKPESQCIKNQGPIPKGTYKIGKAHTHPKLGPIAMVLTPSAGTKMCGRDGFLIHKASSNPDPGSHGCIHMPDDIRKKVDASSDKTLNVVG